jgi:hypothetical protein
VSVRRFYVHPGPYLTIFRVFKKKKKFERTLPTYFDVQMGRVMSEENAIDTITACSGYRVRIVHGHHTWIDSIVL